MSLDLNSDYLKVQEKVQAAKTYNELKDQYDKAVKKVGDSFEKSNSKVQTSLNKVNKGIDKANESINKVDDKLEEFNEKTKSYQKQLKTQFDQLLDLSNLTGGKGSNTIRYIKLLLLKTLRNIEPKIREILLEEIFKTSGCDQNQTYTSEKIYISVKSIDLGGLLKIDPNTIIGRVLYEKDITISPQPFPYSINRQLHNRIVQNTSFSQQYGTNFIGSSGQELFDVKFVDTNPITGVSGGWFEIDLKNRVNGVNSIGEFLVDYYSTTKVVEFGNINANIMNSLTGVISINLNLGVNQVEDATKFELIIARILGLCFDNRSEIDVSGIAKIAELDGVDNSFFEFTEIDLRNIEQTITNIKNGVIEFEDCDNIKLPVNSDDIINGLENLFFVEDNQVVDAADNLTNVLINNPSWQGYAIRGNVDVSVNTSFVKLIVTGLVLSLLSPKILLPLFIMLKSTGQFFMDEIRSYMDFAKKFSKMIINLISKIGAIFVKELFELVKRDIVVLIQQIISDVNRNISDKRITMILKLIQILLIVAQFIADWRRCKSVIDELLQLLTVATTGWGTGIPLPLLFGSSLLGGYSENRAFLNTIQELQKLGIPTGPMPDGSPNLEVLSKFAQMKGMAFEDAENGKVEVALPPIQVPPTGTILPIKLSGKKF